MRAGAGQERHVRILYYPACRLVSAMLDRWHGYGGSSCVFVAQAAVSVLPPVWHWLVQTFCTLSLLSLLPSTSPSPASSFPQHNWLAAAMIMEAAAVLSHILGRQPSQHNSQAEEMYLQAASAAQLHDNPGLHVACLLPGSLTFAFHLHQVIVQLNSSRGYLHHTSHSFLRLLASSSFVPCMQSEATCGGPDTEEAGACKGAVTHVQLWHIAVS